ncbi:MULTISPECIES: ATP-binding protein [Burkholderiaceae]|nr:MULTISPECIES: ATP-binding protein [Burkholderiaceae]
MAYQPSIDGKLVQQLACCHFIEHGDNVIVLGPPRHAALRPDHSEP